MTLPVPHRPAPASQTWGNLLLLISALVLAAGVVALFPLLYFVYLPIPIRLSPSTTQQLINGLASILSAIFGILFGQCLDVTNQQCIQRGLDHASLSFKDLQTRTDASKSAKWALLKTCLGISSGKRSIAWHYLVTLVAFGALNSVLTVLLVISLAERPEASSTLDVTLSANIPSNASSDPCASIDSSNCVYDRVMASLGPLLVTGDPYTVEGFTFQYGSTAGMPVGIFHHFQELASQSLDGKYQVDYCVPLVNGITVSCEQEASPGSRASYQLQSTLNGFDVYAVTINPSSVYADTHVRVQFQDGTMTVAQSSIPGEEELTIITTSGVYVATLSTLMTGDAVSANTYTVVCTSAPSWQWWPVSLFLTNGVNTAALGKSGCHSGLPSDFVPINPLPYFIEGTTRVVNAIDGYSKYINTDVILPLAPPAVGNVSMLDVILSQMYQNVQTVYTLTVLDGTTTTPIPITIYRQAYVIMVTWNVFTILAFAGAVVILACTIGLMIQFSRSWPDQYIELDLTRPIDAMRLAYNSQRTAYLLRNLPNGGTETILKSPVGAMGFGL